MIDVSHANNAMALSYADGTGIGCLESDVSTTALQNRHPDEPKIIAVVFIEELDLYWSQIRQVSGTRSAIHATDRPYMVGVKR